ncbi:hypothetical protein MNV84_04658 [Leishmania braziliensis]|nr:hypothetical protein MNV84_04658 [Leishmania braziliensis]
MFYELPLPPSLPLSPELLETKDKNRGAQRGRGDSRCQHFTSLDLPPQTSKENTEGSSSLPAHVGMSYGDLWKTRYGASVEGWSAVDKVAQFSQAVGCVSGGRGSAILIALMDNRAQLIDTSSLERSGSADNNGTDPSYGLTPLHRSGGGFSAQRAQRRSSRGWSAGRPANGGVSDSPETLGRPGTSHSSTSPQSPPALGVLLTTSHVFRSPQDTANASVRFLDQPIIGMAALLGREPKPVRVGLCSAFGFVSSVAAPKKESEGDTYRANAAATARPSRLDDEPEYLLYASAAGDSSEEDEAAEIGFTLTYCEVFPRCNDAANPTEPSSPLNPSESGGSRGCRTESTTISPSGGLSHYRGGTGLGKEVDEAPASLSESALTQQRGANAVVSDASNAPGGPWSSRFAAAANRNVGGSQDSLFQVQPLPVPLLLSAIPAVKVRDVHLMITHVNDGRRSYRVQHVAAVFADYCTYEPTRFGGVTCSGGPVFNVQGDFIGVQHEGNGQSLCLLIKSIVRNLFDSDLLDMCRCPVSEETIKQRALHVRPGDTVFSTMTTTRPPVFAGPKRMPSLRKNSRPTSLPPLPALSLDSQSLASPRTESCFAVDTPSTTVPLPLATVSSFGSRHTLLHGPSNNIAESFRKDVRPASDGATVANTVSAAALPLTPPSKPLSRGVPSFEEVFAEFYDGAGSLPHILYAFPRNLPLVRVTMERLAQLKYEDELEHMGAIGGVGAILEAIDGYPQEEQIVASALAALCRICLYECNLAMFLYLDGVVTVMEIMKEYVHKQTVLQWGIYTLLLATDLSCPSAAASAEIMVRNSAPQLLVNILRVHGAVQRKSAARRPQHNRLVRWACDLIANLLMTNSRRTTLFLREDFLTLLLQLSRDYAGSVFLMEGFAHVFCAFVQCFTEAEVPALLPILRVSSASSFKQHPAMPSPGNSPASLFRGLGVRGRPSNSSNVAHGGGSDRFPHDNSGPPASPASATLLPYSPRTNATDPHTVSFFFLGDAMRHDTDGCLVRAVLDVCEAALDPKSTITAHRGRPAVVLVRCLETLRLLLTWGLVKLPGGGAMLLAVEDLNFLALASSRAMPTTCASASSLPSLSSSKDTARLLLICKHVRHELTSSSELVAMVEAVQRLLLQDS